LVKPPDRDQRTLRCAGPNSSAESIRNRIPAREQLANEVAAWMARRNVEKEKVE
jgi:hypothetical protein